MTGTGLGPGGIGIGKRRGLVFADIDDAFKSQAAYETISNKNGQFCRVAHVDGNKSGKIHHLPGLLTAVPVKGIASVNKYVIGDFRKTPPVHEVMGPIVWDQ